MKISFIERQVLGAQLNFFWNSLEIRFLRTTSNWQTIKYEIQSLDEVLAAMGNVSVRPSRRHIKPRRIKDVWAQDGGQFIFIATEDHVLLWSRMPSSSTDKLVFCQLRVLSISEVTRVYVLADSLLLFRQLSDTKRKVLEVYR